MTSTLAHTHKPHHYHRNRTGSPTLTSSPSSSATIIPSSTSPPNSPGFRIPNETPEQDQEHRRQRVTASPDTYESYHHHPPHHHQGLGLLHRVRSSWSGINSPTSTAIGSPVSEYFSSSHPPTSHPPPTAAEQVSSRKLQQTPRSATMSHQQQRSRSGSGSRSRSPPPRRRAGTYTPGGNGRHSGDWLFSFGGKGSKREGGGE